MSKSLIQTRTNNKTESKQNHEKYKRENKKKKTRRTFDLFPEKKRSRCKSFNNDNP